MDIQDLIGRFQSSTERQMKAIFSTIFILSNRLQAIFDQRIPEVSLKQFMLLAVARQSKTPLSLTELGTLLGCSRQNVKKLAGALAEKGYVVLEKSPEDARALVVRLTEKTETYFAEEFSSYEKELARLFVALSPEEVATLFSLLMRLYAGVDHLQIATGDVPKKGASS